MLGSTQQNEDRDIALMERPEGIHLRSITGGETVAADPTFFVIQRQNGHWSIAAKIIGVFSSEPLAEAAAQVAKETHPHQTFGVAALRSEARVVAKPIEIVRVGSFEGDA